MFVFQAEDGIRDLVRARGLGDVYKRQGLGADGTPGPANEETLSVPVGPEPDGSAVALDVTCLLYTSDAAAERFRVDLGGRRSIKKKNTHPIGECTHTKHNTNGGTNATIGNRKRSSHRTIRNQQ